MQQQEQYCSRISLLSRNQSLNRAKTGRNWFIILSGKEFRLENILKLDTCCTLNLRMIQKVDFLWLETFF